MGEGSYIDQIMAGLVFQGFTEGSVADRERERLLALTGASDLISVNDLYEEAGEINRLGGQRINGIVLNPNPDVETNIDGWEALNGSIIQSSNFARSGNFSIQFTSAIAGEGQVNQTIATASDVVPGRTYAISVWLRSTVSSITPGFQFTTFDTDFDPTVNDNGPLLSNMEANTWTKIEYITTAPVGVVQGVMKIRLLGLSISDVVYVDLATLEEL